MCLVCRLGGDRVGARNLALKAPVLQDQALIPCVVAVKKNTKFNSNLAYNSFLY